MSSRRDDRETRDAGGQTESDDLDDLLSDLRTTLDRLDRTLREETQRGERASADRRARRGRERGGFERRPRPPSARELLRFTDEYTIPTLIAALESAIRSLELLRGAIRLFDPDRSVRSEGDAGRSRLPRPSDAAREEVAANARRALSELRTALAEADLPDDPESRDIVEDARGLSAEIERRIDESERRRADADREERERSEGGVRIDVSEEGDGASGGDESAGDDGGGSDGADAAVDVEAELRSIKDEVEGARDGPASDEGDDVGGEESDDGGDADGGGSAGR